MVILDTNIIIDHLRRAKNQDSYLKMIAKEKPKENLAIAAISIQELYEGKSTKKKVKEDDLIAIITPLRILSYTYEVAQLAGVIARDLKQSLEFADAAIAATAIVNRAVLATFNKRHFAGIEDLEFFNI